MGASRVNRCQGLGLAAISLALTLMAGASALAADPGVVSTAPTGSGAPAVGAAPPANDATGSQIDAWVASDGGAAQPGSDGPAPRTIHGEVSAGVGTGGYRNVSGVADIPVGQTGDLIVAASSTSGQVRGGRYGGYGFGGDALALGFYANGVTGSAPNCGRQPWGQLQVQGYGAPGQMTCGTAP
jgi:hypothetical protein